jgi:uncharacterized membrane protein YhhN
MAQLIPIPVLLITVPLLVWAALRENKKLVYVLKPVSTLLVILIALLSLFTPNASPAYTWGITLGLVLCLGGDVALMFESNRAFMIGLVLFLLGHVVYAVFFTIPNGFHTADLITGLFLLLFAAGVYLYLKPGLGSMKGPVIAYILIICLMVNRATSTFFGDAFSPTQRWLIFLGAVLFMLSDIVLAVNRFRQPLKYGRLSLLLYYGGQVLIALSPSYFV